MIKAKKSLGQNFLIDKNIIEKIACLINIENKTVLEVGPGTGNLTSALIKKNPKKFYVIEKDNGLAVLLKKEYSHKIEIINDDILNLDNYLYKFNRLSFIYIDCNVYKPVKKILELLEKKLSVNGYIAFDEGQNNIKSGEGRALNEFYKKNKKKFRLLKLKKNYQPDILLKKIK